MESASKMAKLRGISVAGDMPGEIDWSKLLSVAKLKHFKMYEEMAREASEMAQNCPF